MSKLTLQEKLDRFKLRYFWGNPCKYGHKNETGYCIRFLNTGSCVMCHKKLHPMKTVPNPTTMTQLFDHIINKINDQKRQRTEDDVRKEKTRISSKASAEWNARNPEKFKMYQRRHNLKNSIKSNQSQMRKHQASADNYKSRIDTATEELSTLDILISKEPSEN